MTQQWNTPVLVVADDFTGANDAGSGFAAAGALTLVQFDATVPIDSQPANVWVISTDSRAADATLAARRTAAAVESRTDIARDGWVVKKVDSTLRGNLGAETEAALIASGAPAALIIPAVPALGRTTIEGKCFINGVLLTDTEYASDPKTPVTHASVLHRLEAQSALTCGLIPLHAVRQAELALYLQQAMARGERLIVVDAENEEDLDRIIAAAAQLPQRPLLAGAAGICGALSRSLKGPHAALPEAKMRNSDAPVLAVVGSMSEIAQRQIAQLQTHREVSLIDIDISQLFAGRPEASELCQQAVLALSQGKHCLIRTCQQAEQRQAIDGLCARYRLSRQALGEQICSSLADLTRKILGQVALSALYLSGGDVAIAVAKALGSDGFLIKGQVAGCVPYGHLLKVRDDLLVLTKAGGFGDDTTLVEVFRFIEEKASE